jgi:anti-sigma factor RsiW
MSETFQCGDNTALVGYLYDECDPVERAAIAAHVAVCAACAAELAAIGSTRVQLAAWIPPEADLGFLISRRPKTEPMKARPQAHRLPANWFTRPLPGWAQMAAAGVIFAVGLSLGIVRGTMPAAAPAGVGTVVASQTSPESVSPAELAALERRLRDEIATIRTTASRDTLTPSPQPEAQLMARVRALIEESEQRQQQELALRTAEIVRDFDSQRRVDLAQIQRNFGQIEGLTGAEVREQRQMLNYLMRVSQQR